MAEITQMLTPKDVAEILGVHYKTVHVWLREGKLKGIKISYRAWRIPQSALDHFIEQNSNVSPQNGMNSSKKYHQEGSVARTGGTIPGLSIDNNETPQVTMKHYLRDIMGEHIPNKSKDT
jgi:excisionase family DNA binding protein